MPRKEERIAYLNEAILEWASSRHEARISDLSAGGCFVDTIVAIAQGEPVTFDLRTNDGTFLTFSGNVAYTLPGIGFGIKFSGLSDEAKQFLSDITTAA